MRGNGRGTAVFANDLATDVRGQYRELIGNGVEAAEATDTVLRAMGRLADDDEDGVQIWLSLAATQSQLGRLEDRVRDRAVAIIDRGADLDRWREDAPEDVPARERALRELRKRLTGPQRDARAVSNPRSATAPRPLTARVSTWRHRGASA